MWPWNHIITAKALIAWTIVLILAGLEIAGLILGIYAATVIAWIVGISGVFMVILFIQVLAGD